MAESLSDVICQDKRLEPLIIAVPLRMSATSGEKLLKLLPVLGP